MNYYTQHIGDYAKDAGHLSLIEDGAYRRLMDAYYTRERALPADASECCKLARAAKKNERDAVQYVLKEFFILEEDGYHQKRCDQEIAQYLEAEPEREQKRENAKERQRRARLRRSELFEKLREFGITPAWDTPTHSLEASLSRVTCGQKSQPVTRDDTATHTQYPIPNKHQEQPTTSGEELPEQAKVDPIWGSGLAFLKRKGIPESQARSMLGKVRKAAGDIETAALLGRAETEDIASPGPWLMAAASNAKARAGPSGLNGKPPIAQNFSEKTYTGTPDDELPEYLRTRNA